MAFEPGTKVRIRKNRATQAWGLAGREGEIVKGKEPDLKHGICAVKIERTDAGTPPVLEMHTDSLEEMD